MMMKERPIIMSGDNPKLILEERKTQTRRIVKPLPDAPGFDRYALNVLPNQCPYGVASDRLWVREKHAWVDRLVDGFDRADPVLAAYSDDTIIRHECGEQQILTDDSWNLEHPSVRWRPSIHMPRWASRITLEITKVRVERLQDISEEDAEAEGVEASTDRQSGFFKGDIFLPFASSYMHLWDSLHGKSAWDKNPWVWVLEFRRVERLAADTAAATEEGGRRP